METIRIASTARSGLLLGLGICVPVVAAAIGMWPARHDLPPEMVGRPRAEQSRAPDKHITGTVHFDLLAKMLADDRRSQPDGQWLDRLADPQSPPRIATQSSELLGRMAPDFTLEDRLGQPWNLQDQLAGGPVILVFYLGYSCNACVHSLCELSADIDRFHRLGAEVVAVSGDARELTRERFEQFGALAFPVLSDPDHSVARSFGVLRAASGTEPETPLHGTFVVRQDGLVQWVHCGDAPFRDNLALLYELTQSRTGRIPLAAGSAKAAMEFQTP